MKTLYNIELIKWIQNDPKATIGQRSYKLLQAFLLPFDLFCEPDLPAEDLNILESLPSIQSIIEKKFNLELGSRHWTSPLKYNSEDDRELFSLVLNFLFDYEEKFPNPKAKQYKFKLKNSGSIPDLKGFMGHMGYRPQMYFGISELACLRAYIDGYFLMKQTFELPHTEFEKKVLTFISNYKTEDNTGYKSWDRNYRWEWDLSVYGINERHAIPRFLKDIESNTGVDLTLDINGIEVKIDWSDHNSWNKSTQEFLGEKQKHNKT